MEHTQNTAQHDNSTAYNQVIVQAIATHQGIEYVRVLFITDIKQIGTLNRYANQETKEGCING